jgi:transposase InsO family protein
LVIAARRDPDADWPSRSTVCTHLKANGFVHSSSRGRAAVPGPRAPLPPITKANEVWTTDFKGEFRTGDGIYCYPLTLRDGFSRFVLRCDGLLNRTLVATQQRFARAFAEYGLPDRIRSDNGSPFASPGLARLSTLSVWWIRLGILPERIAPGHPEQNGSHEQFHRVLKAETTRPPAPHCAAQQQRFRRFVREYNEERPHDAVRGVAASVSPGLAAARVSRAHGTAARQPVRHDFVGGRAALYRHRPGRRVRRPRRSR